MDALQHISNDNKTLKSKRITSRAIDLEPAVKNSGIAAKVPLTFPSLIRPYARLRFAHISLSTSFLPTRQQTP